MLAQLPGARISQRPHVSLGPELQTAGWTRLDARRFEPLPDAIGAERALVDLLGRRVELRDVERTSRHAVLTADAVLLLEIDDAVGVLDNGGVSGTGAQAPGVFAVHALVLAHQPRECPVLPLVLVELDPVPAIPRLRRH